jgi:organic hydroperoxide reductase OsmC/OhrA
MADLHRYTTSVAWRGSTGDGYEAYSRTHTAAAPPAAGSWSLSSDPAFRGDPSLLNPEALVVLAASSCQLLSFLAVAARARLDVVEYEDDAVGEMPDGERPMRITRIVLRPRITVRGDVDAARLAHLVEVAHRECYVANTLLAEVVVEPTFRTGP